MVDHHAGEPGLLLARCWRGQQTLDSLRSGLEHVLVADSRPPMVFLHGDAVTGCSQQGWLDPLFAQAELHVCSASWQRRFPDGHPCAGQLSSLMRFWQRALSARALIDANGQWHEPDQRRAWLLSYRGDQTAMARREALELVMAGASLDLDLIVFFEAAALASFQPEDLAAWSQLGEQELAGLIADPALVGRVCLSGLTAIDPPALAALGQQRALLGI